MVLAMVPAAPPTWKSQPATSCPAPISAMVPYLARSRLSSSAFCSVVVWWSTMTGIVGDPPNDCNRARARLPPHPALSPDGGEGCREVRRSLLTSFLSSIQRDAERGMLLFLSLSPAWGRGPPFKLRRSPRAARRELSK